MARLGLCTISIAVAVWDGAGSGAHGILNAADSALLAAKQAGRNRVCAPEINVEAA